MLFRSAPNVPTLLESGLAGMEGLDPYTFYGVIGAAGIPSVAVNRINQAVNELLKDPDFVKKLAALEFDPDPPGTPADFGRFLASQLAAWKELGARLSINLN